MSEPPILKVSLLRKLMQSRVPSLCVLQMAEPCALVEIGGMRDDVWRAQIRHTIKKHLDREVQLNHAG